MPNIIITKFIYLYQYHFLIFSDKAFFAFFIATQGGAPPPSSSFNLRGKYSDITG
jgi:hypothetical protein